MGLSWKDFDPRNVVNSVSNTVANPTKKFSQATGIKIPTKIKIGGTTIGTGSGLESVMKQTRASIRDLDNTRIQAAKDRDNAQKGEIGKYYSGQFDTLQNINPITVGTRVAQGESPLTSLKKIGGSYLNSGSAGVIPYAGKSSSFQDFMRDKNVSKNTLGFSENYAGYSRGTATLVDTGNLSNDDRNNIIQSYVKTAGVAGFGGWLNSLFSGGGAAAPATEGAVVVETGTPYYTGATVSSTEIATGVTTTTTVGGAAAPVAGSSWLSGSTLSNAAIGYSLLTGKQAPTSIGDLITNPNTQPDMGFIGDLLNGGGRQYISPDITGDGAGAYGGDNVQEAGISPLILIGVAVGGYLLYRKFAK